MYKKQLKEFPNIKVNRSQGRMFVVLNGHDPEPVIEKCKNVFGIYSMSLAMKVANEEEAMKEAGLDALKKHTEQKRLKFPSVVRINNFQDVTTNESNFRSLFTKKYDWF